MSLPRFSPRRPLGRTGFHVTAVGAGDLADRSRTVEQCADTLRRILDTGVNVVDTAPNYEDGHSERIVGAALRGRRDGVFVIDKVDHLVRPGVPQVGESLERLGMETADLFVFHDVSKPEAWEALAREGGGLAQLEACVRQGKARFRGISSHHPDVLHAALASGRCDVVMFPVGPFVNPRYLLEILPMARQQHVGVVGFKAFGAGKLLGDSEGYGKPLEGPGGLPRLTVEECLRYTLTLDPDVQLLGLSSEEEQDAALPVAARFRPYSTEEMADVRRRAHAAIEGKGRVWWDPPHAPAHSPTA